MKKILSESEAVPTVSQNFVTFLNRILTLFYRRNIHEFCNSFIIPQNIEVCMQNRRSQFFSAYNTHRRIKCPFISVKPYYPVVQKNKYYYN